MSTVTLTEATSPEVAEARIWSQVEAGFTVNVQLHGFDLDTWDTLTTLFPPSFQAVQVDSTTVRIAKRKGVPPATTPTGGVLKIGTHNVEFGHNPAVHGRQILQEAKSHGLDVLALQETKDYVAYLAAHAAEFGYRLVFRNGGRGQDQNVFLVRQGLDVSGVHVLKATGPGWFRKGGGTHAPEYPLAAKIAGVWFVSTHDPSDVHVSHGHLSGPAPKVKAYLQGARRLVAFLSAHPTAVLLGDRNNPVTVHGVGTPAWVAEQSGSTLYGPPTATHGAHAKIDSFTVRGARLLDVLVHAFDGSDHRLVTGTLHY